MATTKKKKKTAMPKRVVDDLYQKYTASVVKALASDQFYDFFVENLKQGERSFQFSNRQLKKSVDETWVSAVEACMEPFNNIIMNPRNFIVTKEEIVNVAVARQSTPDVIRHLTTHGAYVDEVNEDNVRPNHLLNKFNEDTWNTYENRFVYTLLEKTVDFVSKRYNALFGISGDEFGTFLKADTLSKNHTDYVKVSLDIRLRKNEEELNDDENSTNILARVARLNERLKMYNESLFARTMRHYIRVKNPIVKTNAIRKNPNFKACYELWVFLYAYTDVGYKIDIYEQSSVITPAFEQDIYHSIFFNYLILKNYLEEYQDRLIDTTRSYTKKTLKPRYIRQIVEEIVKNYDMPDVEIRKILVDEITRAQLAEMESRERKRLVEEKRRRDTEQRKRDAIRKAKDQKRRQQERAKLLRQKEEEKARREREREKHRAQLAKRAESMAAEIERFERELDAALQERQRAAEELARQRAALAVVDTSLKPAKPAKATAKPAAPAPESSPEAAPAKPAAPAPKDAETAAPSPESSPEAAPAKPAAPAPEDAETAAPAPESSPEAAPAKPAAPAPEDAETAAPAPESSPEEAPAKPAAPAPEDAETATPARKGLQGLWGRLTNLKGK